MIQKVAASLGLRVFLTGAVLVYMATRMDFGAAASAAARLSITAGLATLMLVAFDRVIVVWRWVILLRAAGATITTTQAVRIHLVSSFLGGFLPAGVGADAARAFALLRRTAAGGQAIASVAVDRALGLLSILVVGFAGAMLWSPRLGDDVRWLFTLASMVSIVVCVGFLWADRAIRVALPTGWYASPLPARLLRLADALALYRHRRTSLAAVLLLSVVVQLLRILQAYLLGTGIGLAVPFAYYLVFMPIGLMALLLPVSISGFGIPQGVIVWLLQPMGVPEADAFALSTLIVLSGLAGTLPGACLYLTDRGPAPGKAW